MRETILRAIDLIESHLQESITVAEMAESVSYSLYHFCRMFSKFTRHTPYDYLMRRRMTLAAHQVITTQQKIVDIAFAYQFESHEGFTRAFQRMFGLCPTEARRQNRIPALRSLPRLSDAHLRYLEAHPDLTPVFLPVLPPAADLPRLAYNRLNGAPANACLVMLPDAVPESSPMYARFTLDSSPPRVALDWILHVWLFYAPYEAGAQEILLLPPDLYVPVLPN
ncbi:MAG: AraC family transcriptional regulator [Anaerolineae bacterium]|nr:AraC family transcriptional regulator [Anaerolineae bacterium]